jgi:hypothetical protein
MEPSRQLHKEGHLAKDAVEAAALMEPLEQPAAEKAKEAEAFTCKGCTGKYTDARGSGGDGKRNFGFCSRKCRPAKRARKQCEHGRQQHQCKDCGTGHCQHGRQRGKCKNCGTGHALPARAPEGKVQGLRHGPLPARAPEAPVQGVLNAATASTGARGASAGAAAQN